MHTDTPYKTNIKTTLTAVSTKVWVLLGKIGVKSRRNLKLTDRVSLKWT